MCDRFVVRCCETLNPHTRTHTTTLSPAGWSYRCIYIYIYIYGVPRTQGVPCRVGRRPNSEIETRLVCVCVPRTQASWFWVGPGSWLVGSWLLVLAGSWLGPAFGRGVLNGGCPNQAWIPTSRPGRPSRNGPVLRRGPPFSLRVGLK